MKNTVYAQEYLIRALCYAGYFGLTEHNQDFQTGREIADFLLRAVSVDRLKKDTYVLHGVHTATWWKMFHSAYAKLGCLDELMVKEFLEARGFWFHGAKPETTKQIFGVHNFNKIYDMDLAANGWRLIKSQQHLRGVVDRFNGGK